MTTSRSVNVVATGARTPIGLHCAASAAAYRGRISGVREHPFMIDRAGNPMIGALDSEIDPDMTGPDRFLALAIPALREVCEPLAGHPTTRSGLPLYLGLPEVRPGFTMQDAAAIRLGLQQAGSSLPIYFPEIDLFPHGHAAGLSALWSAAEKIRKGTLDACLVGAVDSYFHPETMEWLDDNLQLAGALARSAFVPGEGAGFCLLMSREACARWHAEALGRIVAAALGNEVAVIKGPELCLGFGLTSVIRGVIGQPQLPQEKINAVFCDINGERYRSEEWGFACLRLSQYFDDPAACSSPADCWGDMGAASGPLFVMLACQAARRGYGSGPRTLIWASSESGLRAAALLDTRRF
jgi:3-oxoacyl-[acyl-carrier-protein] synthase-1